MDLLELRFLSFECGYRVDQPRMPLCAKKFLVKVSLSETDGSLPLILYPLTMERYSKMMNCFSCLCECLFSKIVTELRYSPMWRHFWMLYVSGTSLFSKNGWKIRTKVNSVIFYCITVSTSEPFGDIPAVGPTVCRSVETSIYEMYGRYNDSGLVYRLLRLYHGRRLFYVLPKVIRFGGNH